VRFGRLYRDLLLALFVEHLGVAAGLAPGRNVVDVLCDGGAATALAARRVGTTGSVTAVDYMHECLAEASAMNNGTSLTLVTCSREALPLPDATFDCAVNLLTAGWAESSLLEEMRRVTKPGGRTAVLSYAGGDAVHERLLLESVTDVTGASPKYAEPLLTQLPKAGMHVAQVRDVVRFDSAHQYWDVMVDGRAIFDGDDQQAREVRDLVTHKLKPFTAADGTIRIPVDLALLTSER